jgi:uncharacterized protein (TIGR03437 family)
MLASIYGERLSWGEQVASRLPLLFQMNATVVKVNGTEVPLLYVGPGQVNFVLPQDLVVGPARVTVSNAGSESAATQIMIQDTAPAIFGARPLPVRPGAAIEIYATGFGGSTATPTVSIGGQNAEVLFSGPSQQFSGLHQVNVRVPTNAQPGASVPLRIDLGGRSSNTLTITISP